MYLGPSLYTRWGPLHIRLWLWEEWISYLWGVLYRLLMSWRWGYFTFQSPRTNLWHRPLSQQHWYQVLFIWHVLCKKVWFSIPLLTFLHLNLLFPGVHWHRQIKMNRGALAPKNASTLLLNLAVGRMKINVFHSASMERYGLRIVCWAQGNVWNTTSARSILEIMSWDATMTLSRLTS